MLNYSEIKEKIIGKSLEEAQQIAKEEKMDLRIRAKDGVSYLGTSDFHIYRINIRIKDNKVTDVGIG